MFAGLLHIYYNWKPILAYMKDKARRIKVFTGASNVGLALTIIFIVGTYFNVQPMSTIMDISEHFKSTATAKYGEPPYGQAQSSSLQMFTGRMNLDLKKSMELLEATGISVSDEKETLSDIAKRSGKTPQQVYEIIKPATQQPAQASPEHSANEAPTMNPLVSGMGKKTITQICSEIGIEECDEVIKKLEEKGIKVESDEKVKDAATANGLDPMQIFEAMTEIVSNKSAP